MSINNFYKNMKGNISFKLIDIDINTQDKETENIKAQIIELISSFRQNVRQNQFFEARSDIDHIYDIVYKNGENFINVIDEFGFVDLVFELFKAKIYVIQFNILQFLSLYCCMRDDVYQFYTEDFLKILNEQLINNVKPAFVIFANIITTDYNYIIPKYIGIDSFLEKLESNNIKEVAFSISCLRNALHYSNYPFFLNYENIHLLIKKFCEILHRKDINNPCIEFISKFIIEIITNIDIYEIVLLSGIFHFLHTFLFVPEYFQSQKIIFLMFNEVTNFLIKIKDNNKFVNSHLNLFFEIGKECFFPLHTFYLILTNKNTKIDIDISLSMLRKYIKINKQNIEDIHEYIFIIDKLISEYQYGSFNSKNSILLLIYSIILNDQKEIIEIIFGKRNFINDLINSLTIDDSLIFNNLVKIFTFILSKNKNFKNYLMSCGILDVLSEIEVTNPENFQKFILSTNFSQIS